jgi:transposase
LVYENGLVVNWTRKELEQIARIKKRKYYSRSEECVEYRKCGVVKLFLDGYSKREITHIYGLQFSRVNKIINEELNINTKEQKIERKRRDKAICNLYQSGMTLKEIADLFALNYECVQSVIRRKINGILL